jgi:hypothetical protein
MSQSVNDDLTLFNTPVNVSSNFFISSNIDVSTPIRSLGIIFSATSQESWSRGINIINTAENIQSVFSHTIDINFGNRRKRNWDIKTGGSITLNDSKFSISETNNNIFFNTTNYIDFRYTPNDQWSFDTSANVVNFNSKNFTESVSIPLINATINYNFLEGNKAGLALYIHDLLNRYSGFERISGANFLMEQERNNIGRYVMLTFNLRRGSRLGR